MNLPDYIRDLTGEALTLAREVDSANAHQYDAPAVTRERLDTHRDPVGEIATDDRRLALRAAVFAAEAALRDARTAIRDARTNLARTFARWDGTDEPEAYLLGAPVPA